MDKLWRQFTAFIKFSYKEQVTEICGGSVLGIFVGWDWIFTDVSTWLAPLLAGTWVVLKGLICSSLSSLATTWVSFKVKNYLKNKLNDKRQKGRKRDSRDDWAA
jgi:hypothetical protein